MRWGPHISTNTWSRLPGQVLLGLMVKSSPPKMVRSQREKDHLWTVDLKKLKSLTSSHTTSDSLCSKKSFSNRQWLSIFHQSPSGRQAQCTEDTGHTSFHRFGWNSPKQTSTVSNSPGPPKVEWIFPSTNVANLNLQITRLFCRKNVVRFFGGLNNSRCPCGLGEKIYQYTYHISYNTLWYLTSYLRVRIIMLDSSDMNCIDEVYSMFLKISHLFTWFRHEKFTSSAQQKLAKATLAGTSPCHDIHQVTEIGQMLLHGEFFKHGIVLWTNRKLLSSQFQICFYVVAINEDLSRCSWCQTNNTIKSCSLSCTIVS